MITVVVADDQPLIRSGIAMMLDAEPDIVVVAEASDGGEAIAMTRLFRPSVTLMDVRMPVLDGPSATRVLCRDCPDDPPARVLMLSTYHDDEAVYGALQAGASGYLLKQAAPADLTAAVRRVAGGDAWLDPSVAGRVIKALSRVPQVGRLDALSGLLTPRERQVLTLMAEGLSNAEIGERLVVGEGTVKTHVSRVLMKSASRDRAQAIALAYRSGLVTPPVLA